MTGLDLLVVTLLLSGGGQAQPDALEPVRQLYASAEYESALLALERLPADDAPTEGLERQRYRALCLMALGRTAEAEKVIEQVLSIDPEYQADEQDPPRVRSAYATVRARVLPQVARATYTDAKAAYDRRDYQTATSGFTRAIELLGLMESADPALGDLRTLASGFLDLSRAAAKPAPPPAPPEPVPTPASTSAPALATSAPAPVTGAPAPATSTPAPATSAPLPTTSAEPAPAAAPPPDREAPPVVIAQPLPAWNPSSFGSQYQSEFRGAIEVTIDERGRVSAAKIVEPVHPAYDFQLLEAARDWRYEPARRGGQPVISIKRVDIVLRPR